MDAKTTALKTIDWKLSISLANNREELALELLNLLMAELPQTKENINTAYQNQDFEMLHHYVHKLHGATCYCGVPRLKEITADLETKLKSKKAQQLAETLNNLNDEIDQVQLAFKKNEYRS